MNLAQKIEEVLRGELKPENIKTVIEMAEFLKFKEQEKKWSELCESEPEYTTTQEEARLEKLKAEGKFVDQDVVLKELGINKDEI